MGRGVARTTLSLAAEPYAAGVRAQFQRRYEADLVRLHSRDDFPEDAHWFDSHCHLESILQRTWRGGGKPQVTEREPEVDLCQLVDSWPAGLDGCICNCAFRRPSKPGFPSEWSWIRTNMPHFLADGPIAGKLWFTIGIHPHDAASWDANAERTARELASSPKCVGIGECGLDLFKHDGGELEKQLRAFRGQAKLAVELGKALVVHARLVTEEYENLFLEELRRYVPRTHPIHMHCFSDSLDYAHALLDGWPNLHIGFTGSITFKDKPGKGGKGGRGAKGAGGVVEKKGEAHNRELVARLPLERLLIETDGPYMCPEPFRGQTAHPGHVHRVAEQIAEWQRRDLGEVLRATRLSTRAVYGV